MVDKPPKPLSDKELREKKLAEALRVNLRRRKATAASPTAKAGSVED